MPKTIYDVNLVDLLPPNMVSDPKFGSICAAFDAMNQIVVNQIIAVSVLDNIGNQPAAVTDLLAVEHQTPYYNQALSLATRQALLANSGKMNAILGTKEAVEETVKTAYGACKMQEWFEYAGTPGHFRMLFENNPNLDTQVTEINRAIAASQRLSCHLDSLTNATLVGNLISWGTTVSTLIAGGVTVGQLLAWHP